MKRILFITPPYHAGVVEVAGRWVPLNMVYLAGAAREAGFDAYIYDAMTKGVGHPEIEKRISAVRPDYVATSAITCTLPDAIMVMETAKKVSRDITTLLGGIHPSFMCEEIFSLTGSVDYIIRGEGERPLVELLASIEAGKNHASVKGLAYRNGRRIVETPMRPLIPSHELDNLPKAWDLLDWEDYNYFVIPESRLGALDTSRGCNKDCRFCSQRMFWQKKWRGRSPEGLLNEVKMLKERFGVNVILLTDDYPTYDAQRWERFLDLLIKSDIGVYFLMETRVEDILRDRPILSKYRRAGIIHIYLGTEATDQTTLDLFKKDIRVEDAKEALRLLNSNDIITETSMILGLPDESMESIRRTLETANEFNPDFCHFLAITPWPYAEMYAELEPYIKVRDYRRYNLIDPVIKPKRMTLKDIDSAIVECYREFYMRKLGEIKNLENKFKRDYLLTAMRLMMTSSFLVGKIGGLGDVPPDVKKMLSIFQAKER